MAIPQIKKNTVYTDKNVVYSKAFLQKPSRMSLVDLKVIIFAMPSYLRYILQLESRYSEKSVDFHADLEL